MNALSLVPVLDQVPASYRNEEELQSLLHAQLIAAGIHSEREVRLSDGRSRIDILAGRIGIEVKVKGSLADVRRQLSRYAATGDIDELVLVTTRSAHHRIPPTIAGVPLVLCSLVGRVL